MDDEFEPTAEMMVDDFDDEGTLDEAEADETAEQQVMETNILKKEQEIPIEKLLEMYGGGAAAATSNHDEQAEDESDGDQEKDDCAGQENGDSSVSSGCHESQSESTSCAASVDRHEDVDKKSSQKKEDAVPVKEEATTEDTLSRSSVTLGASRRGHKRRRTALSVLYPELSRKNAAPESNTSSGSPAASAVATSTSVSLADRRLLRSEDDGAGGEESDSSDADGDEASSDESSWRKTIMIGSVYQAQVPDGLAPYGDRPPYENDDKLLWQPAGLSASGVEEFLRRVHQARLAAAEGVAAVPCGSHTRDHEEALYILQQCNHNVEEALRRSQMNTAPVQASGMSLWSEEECAGFENGLRFYGKDFFQIQQQKVRTRSVGELVQFYYLWKKTERHDVFANKTKLEKRKYALNPGVTDYMERFIDEQDREACSQSRISDSSATDAASLQILMAAGGPTIDADDGWASSEAATNSTSVCHSQCVVDGSSAACATAPLVPP